jgi:hypothetical protein
LFILNPSLKQAIQSLKTLGINRLMIMMVALLIPSFGAFSKERRFRHSRCHHRQQCWPGLGLIRLCRTYLADSKYRSGIWHIAPDHRRHQVSGIPTWRSIDVDARCPS